MTVYCLFDDDDDSRQLLAVYSTQEAANAKAAELNKPSPFKEYYKVRAFVVDEGSQS